MRKQASLVIGAGLAFSVTASIVACHTAESKANSSAASVPSAKVAAAQQGDITHVLTLAGQFQPYQVVDVHPKVSGYMSRINVDIGDIVHEGQTLAVLEVPELKAQLQQTVFQLQQTKEEITHAQHDVSRAEAEHAALHAQSGSPEAGGCGTFRPGLMLRNRSSTMPKPKDLSSEAQVDAAKSALAAAQEHEGSAESERQRVEALHN